MNEVWPENDVNNEEMRTLHIFKVDVDIPDRGNVTATGANEEKLTANDATEGKVTATGVNE